MGVFEKIFAGLKKTRDSISNQLGNIFKSFRTIDEELFEELEETLVMGDVGITTAEKICDSIKEKVKENNVKDPEEIGGMLKNVISEMLSGNTELRVNTKPSVILVIGVNGAGKTTTIGKMAHMFKEEGKTVILSAADTFRAAAIEQLEVWAQRSKADIVKHAQGSDPAAVVFDSVAAAKSRNADIVICDTAGRLHNKKNLMEELSKINRVIDRELPNADKEVLLVLDATTGQNAVNQAKEFSQSAGITGIVLTKLDGTAKGGVVIRIMDELKIPVKFIGVGEQLDDLQKFDAESFTEALFER